MSTRTAEIRAATPADRQAILALQERLFANDPNRLDHKRFDELVRTKPEYLLAAERNGEIAGFLLLTDRPLRPWTGCDFVGVAPSHRRRGIAKSLVAAALNTLRRPFLRLFVRPTNVAALELYRQMGFIHVSTRKASYNNGEDAFVMMRWAGLPWLRRNR